MSKEPSEIRKIACKYADRFGNIDELNDEIEALLSSKLKEKDEEIKKMKGERRSIFQALSKSEDWHKFFTEKEKTEYESEPK